ncbi:hypothetical protein [Dysgonomonas termitidis]|jgi:hypothetical protein|uniref:Lipoprotein n=1 Tax=Dysgonomonas termitidis TaxID=1516126 RepID=A0ABV9L0K0_9BACT
MKKCIFSIIILFGMLSSTSCQSDLDKMGEAVKSHFKYRDADNGTITKIEEVNALSYKEIPEDKRENPGEVYLCKVYVRGTWSYANSFRIYNINDTLDCFFSKNKTFLRIGQNKAD